MAVAVEVTLPAQPAIGLNTYTPLGGDGWTDPHSVSEVSVSSAGDASAGNNVITVNFDNRFVSVVTYIRLANSSASAGIEMHVSMLPLDRAQPQMTMFYNDVPVIQLFGQNVVTWAPAPLPHMGRMIATTTNTNGDTLSLMAYIYQFQRTALQQVPLSRILASLPRGDSATWFPA